MTNTNDGSTGNACPQRRVATPADRAIRITRWALFVVSAQLSLSIANAQGPAVGGGFEQRRPAERLRDVPLPERPAPAAPDISVPVPPSPARRPGLAGELEVPIAGVQLLGSTQLTREDVETVAAPYLRKGTVTTDELEAMRQEFTRLYIERGFRTSGVVLPDQTPAANNNVIVFQAFEGQLGRIQVTGVDRLQPRYVEDRLRLDADAPLDVDALRDRVQILLNDPSIAGVRARLEPGERLGEADLQVDVEERPVFSLDLTVDNRRSPSVGELQFGTHATFQNFTGLGERLRYHFQYTEGFSSHEAELGVPITARDTWLVGRIYDSDSDVVESPFDRVDIKSKSTDLEIGIYRPFYRRPGKEFLMGLQLERRRSKTFLLGQPFSFSPGVQSGTIRVSPVRFWQSWLDAGRDHVFALRSVFSFGLSAFNATRNDPPLPDGRFVAWLGQAQFIRRLGERGTQLVLRANAQLTPDSLLPLEQFSVGGLSSVRGYRENQLVQDNGVNATVELRIPLIRVPIPGLSKRSTDGMLEFVPFYDYGRVWRAEGSTPGRKQIHSVGAGLRYLISPQAEGAIFVGHQLQEVPDPVDESLQDDGIHFYFRMSYR